MSNYGFIFCIVLQFLCVKSEEKCAGGKEGANGPNGNGKSAGPSKYNAILFLADPSADPSPVNNENNPKNAMTRSVSHQICPDFLNLEEKCRIRHCTSQLESTIGDSIDGVIRYSRDTCKCEELLKTSLLELMNYCRDTLRMATAIASVSNNSFTSDIRFRNSESHAETRLPDKETNQNNQGDILIKAKNVTVREDQEAMPRMERISNDGDIFPIFELFNPERRMKFNEANRWHRNRKRSKLDVITEPEHTEVFKIRSRRDVMDRQDQMPDGPSYYRKDVGSKTNNIWDFLNLMENFRMSFFNNLFDSNAGDKSEEDSNFDIGELGKVREISLFDIVKKTFTAVSSKNESGFLLIVIGGRLMDKCNPYSQLMQSMKFLIENTDESNTLLVLTGSCPTPKSSSEAGTSDTVDMGEGVSGNKPQIPVFARGCHSEIFSESNELYDVPVAIRKFLTQKYSKDENKASNSDKGSNADVFSSNGKSSETRNEEEEMRRYRGKDTDVASGSEIFRNKRSLLNEFKRNTQKFNTGCILQVFISYSVLAALFIHCF